MNTFITVTEKLFEVTSIHYSWQIQQMTIWYCSFFSWKQAKETICMECQSLFSGKNKKNISKCCLLEFLPSMLNVKCNKNHIFNTFSFISVTKKISHKITPVQHLKTYWERYLQVLVLHNHYLKWENIDLYVHGTFHTIFVLGSISIIYKKHLDGKINTSITCYKLVSTDS